MKKDNIVTREILIKVQILIFDKIPCPLYKNNFICNMT